MQALKDIVRFLCGVVVLITMLAAISPVQAQGETLEFENTTPLRIPTAEPCCAVTTASLYPSSIEVPGMDGIITKVSVTLHGLTFSNLEDLAVLLTGPSGNSVVLMASFDRGHPNASSDAMWSVEGLADGHACPIPEGTFWTGSGSNGPVDCGLLAPFPAPAPEGPYTGSLDTVGNSNAGEGVWSLYVYGYSGGEGVIANGWSLRIERRAVATLPVPPVNTALPSISGIARVGQMLSCEPGSWLGIPPPSSFSDRWLLSETGVVEATGPSYVVQNSDQGNTLRCEVTAASVAGQKSAISAGLVVSYDEPSGESSDLGSTGSSTGVDISSIRAMLTEWLTRSGNMTKVAALLKAGALSLRLHAPRAGTVVVDWYEDPLGIRGSSVRGRTLVAFGKLTFPVSRTATLKIRLTAEGKRLLKRTGRLKLTARGTFTTVGMVPITTTRTFRIK